MDSTTTVFKMSKRTLSRKIIKMEDPVIGEYFVCKDCKHFMLSMETAKLHLKCTKKLLPTFEPQERIYCSTCGRYFDNREQWGRHNDLHKAIGDYDPIKFVYSIDANNFVKNLLL